MRERDGYDAPEVVSRRFGPVTSKSDVYSYGVMVLEMVRAKRHVRVGADTTSKYFAQWLYEHLDEFCDSVSDINGDTRELVRKMIDPVDGLVPVEWPCDVRSVVRIAGQMRRHGFTRLGCSPD